MMDMAITLFKPFANAGQLMHFRTDGKNSPNGEGGPNLPHDNWTSLDSFAITTSELLQKKPISCASWRVWFVTDRAVYASNTVDVMIAMRYPMFFGPKLYSKHPAIKLGRCLANSAMMCITSPEARTFWTAMPVSTLKADIQTLMPTDEKNPHSTG